jgi:hypothetical protein
LLLQAEKAPGAEKERGKGDKDRRGGQQEDLQKKLTKVGAHMLFYTEPLMEPVQPRKLQCLSIYTHTEACHLRYRRGVAQVGGPTQAF